MMNDRSMTTPQPIPTISAPHLPTYWPIPVVTAPNVPLLPVVRNVTMSTPVQTRRDSQFQLPVEAILPKPRLYTISEIKDLLERKLCTKISDSEAETFATETGFLPITLQLAVAYIIHQRTRGYDYTVANFNTESCNQSITETLTKLSWHSSEILGCTISLLDAWKFPISNVENHNYGHIAMRLMNVLAYTIGKQVPIELLYNVPNTNSNEVENALKLLQGNHLVNQNDVSLTVNPLLLRILRSSMSNEFTVLFDLLTAFKSCCVHDSRVGYPKYPRFPSINFTTNLIECWKYVDFHDELVTSFSDLPLTLCISEYHYSSSINMMDAFLQNHSLKLETILGFDNVNLLKLYYFYIHKLEDKNKVMEVCLHVIRHSTSQNEYVLSIRTHLAKCMVSVHHYNEAYGILIDAYEEQKRCRGIDKQKLLDTLTVMFTAVCHLQMLGVSEPFTRWINLIKRDINDPNSDKNITLSLLTSIVENQIELLTTTSMKIVFTQLFDELYIQICLSSPQRREHPFALKILYQKADFLYKLSMYNECIEVYHKIIEIQDNMESPVDQDDKFNTVLKMLKPCIKYFSKDPSHYKICENLIETRINNPSADHKLTRIALYTLEKYACEYLPISFVVKIYDHFIRQLTAYNGVSHVLTLKVMLDRASFLADSKVYEPARNGYLKVCSLKNMVPKRASFTNISRLISELRKKL